MSLIQWTNETSNTMKVVLIGSDGDDSPIVVKTKAEADEMVLGWLCRKVSPGCLHCYAEGRNLHRWPPGMGVGLPYVAGSFAAARPVLREDQLAAMLRWKKTRMVFPINMSDIFLSMARCRVVRFFPASESDVFIDDDPLVAVARAVAGARPKTTTGG